MYFTKEDFKKIDQWLKRNSVKDTEFMPASKLEGNETITIIQNGKNKNLTLADIVGFVQFEALETPIVAGDTAGSAIQYIGECKAKGFLGTALGYHTESNNEAEIAFGKFNSSNEDTIMSCGIGTVENRRNAIEVTKDGKIYILNIGDYHGDNNHNSEDITSIINTLGNKIKNIEDSITKIKANLNEITEIVE